jgi:hypothetical protein
MDGREFSAESTAMSGEVLCPAPTKINLHNAEAIRRELGSVYRDMRAGRIDPQYGARLAYVLDMIRKSYESEVLQKRIELLERTIEHEEN